MKKLTLTLALITLSLTSCTHETIEESCNHQQGRWESIALDTEDNLIKFGNSNEWMHNTEYPSEQYLQRIGYKMDNNQLIISTTDGKRILQAQLLEVNPADVSITIPNDTTVVFYSESEALMNAGDTYYVNLKLTHN